MELNRKNIIILLFLALICLLCPHLLLNYGGKQCATKTDTAIYPREVGLIGTYQLYDTLNKKNRWYISIEKTDTIGRYKLSMYRDDVGSSREAVFSSAAPLYIEYHSANNKLMEYTGKSKERVDTFQLEDGELIQFDRKDLQEDIILWKKISDNVLTDKELNKNHYPLRKLNSDESDLADWSKAIKKFLKEND